MRWRRSRAFCSSGNGSSGLPAAAASRAVVTRSQVGRSDDPAQFDFARQPCSFRDRGVHCGPVGSCAAGDNARVTQLAAPPVPARLDRLAAYREARRKGVAWLLRHLNADGSIGDPTTGFSYYRAPWAFTVVGETEAALAVSAWIRRNLVTPDGEIDGPYRVFDEWSTYRDATLVVGAQLASQYDLSVGLWPGILRRRDPSSGLFANDRLPGWFVVRRARRLRRRSRRRLRRARRRGPHDGPRHRRLPGSPLGCPARVAGSLPSRLVEAPSGLDPRGRPRVPGADHAPRSHGRTASQHWFFGGICAAFLCRLFMADPRPEYLALARRYQDFAIGSTDGQFNWPAACKGSWGSSLLWQLTGDPRYEAFTFRMGDWYVERQEPDGCWHPLVEETLGDVIEITPRVRDAPRHADRSSRRATRTRGSLAPPLTRLVGPDGLAGRSGQA